MLSFHGLQNALVTKHMTTVRWNKLTFPLGNLKQNFGDKYASITWQGDKTLCRQVVFKFGNFNVDHYILDQKYIFQVPQTKVYYMDPHISFKKIEQLTTVILDNIRDNKIVWKALQNNWRIRGLWHELDKRQISWTKDLWKNVGPKFNEIIPSLK